MEFDSREQRIVEAVGRWDEKDTTKRIFFALLKFCAFAVIVLLVLNLIFGDLMAVDSLAFALTIVTLMVYDLKGREILFYRIIKKLQARVKELEKK